VLGSGFSAKCSGFRVRFGGEGFAFSVQCCGFGLEGLVFAV